MYLPFPVHPCLMAVLYFSVAPCMVPDTLGASPWGGVGLQTLPSLKVQRRPEEQGTSDFQCS